MQWLLFLQSTGSRVLGLQYCSIWTQELQFAGSVAQAQEFWHMGLVAPRHVGSSQIRGSNLCLLHWQVDSLPLSPQGSCCSRRTVGWAVLPWREVGRIHLYLLQLLMAPSIPQPPQLSPLGLTSYFPSSQGCQPLDLGCTLNPG